MHTLRVRFVAAVILAAAAFSLYHSSLLPGLDLGDSASLQFDAGRGTITPREGYPLYFAIAGLFVNGLPVERAHAANLASAAEAAAAIGLVLLAGCELAGSLGGGVVAALLLAGSYTFWSQAVTAEVYSLHILMATASLLALLWWYRKPSLGRLAAFFALFALGFGDHLSMVLLMPGFALFLLVAAPGGPREMLRPRVLAMAVGIAALFAMQYAWNFSSMFQEPGRPGVVGLFQNFWFDVTKTDWRATMVATTPSSMNRERLAMCWFDLRQQVGIPGVVAALAGIVALFRRQWRLGLLLVLLWAVNWAFAFTYNVGDVHVFFIPSHWAVALAAGCGAGWAVAAAQRRAGSRAAVALAVALAAYPAWRIFDTFPALDRSDERQATRFLDQFTAGLDGEREVLGVDMNWQLHNGFEYYSGFTRTDLVMFYAPETLLYFPFLVESNAAIGRRIVLAEGAAGMVKELYGNLYRIEPDPRLPVRPLAARLADLPAGTPYVLTMIEADKEAMPLDQGELSDAARALGMRPRDLPSATYAAVGGRIGERPTVRLAGSTPFRAGATIGPLGLDIRFDCWIPFDTIRRMGFGHVIVGRHQALTMERGVSFVAFAPDGRVLRREWASGIYAPERRFLVQ